jgi:hypothetical protein
VAAPIDGLLHAAGKGRRVFALCLQGPRLQSSWDLGGIDPRKHTGRLRYLKVGAKNKQFACGVCI